MSLDGKLIHADYDLQGVYRRRDDGAFAKVEMGDAADHPKGATFLDLINAELFPGHSMVMHGDNDTYVKVTREGELERGRLPEPDERFLICEPDGKISVAEGVKSLNDYYDGHRIYWPYAKVKPNPQ